MIRREISELIRLGAFPSSEDVVTAVIEKQESLLKNITPPVTDEEARELIKLFGPDDYFGGAWTLVHLIETSPHWPLWDSLTDASNEWVAHLRHRIANAEVKRR